MRPNTPFALSLLSVISFTVAASATEASTPASRSDDCQSCGADDSLARTAQAELPVITATVTNPDINAKPQITAKPLSVMAIPRPEEEDYRALSSTPATAELSVAPVPDPPEASAPAGQPDGRPTTAQNSAPPTSTVATPHPDGPEVAADRRSTAERRAVSLPAPQSQTRPLPPVAEPQSARTVRAPVSLPDFVTPSRPTTNAQRPDLVASSQSAVNTQPVIARPPHPQGIRSAPASPTPSRSGAKQPLSLPQLAAQPDLPATDVLSVWQRSVPPLTQSPAQNWAAGLPHEAVPDPVVHPPRMSPSTTPAGRNGKPASMTATSPQTKTMPPSTLATVGSPQPTARSTELTARAVARASQQARLLTQTTAPDNIQSTEPISPEQPREDLLIDPLATDAEPTITYPPSPNAGIPSAFGAAWGDFFVSATAAGADRLRREVDGSISAGFGVGNPRTLVAVELAYNLLSIRNFAENGSFDAKVHRELFSNDTTQAAIAVGWNNFANYGNDVAGTESSVYGVVSAAHLLQPDHPTNRMPITGTVGVGGGTFSQENSDVGVLAGVGLQVDPRLSVNTAWSGVGLNIGLSIVPIPTIPLTLNAVYGDVTNNTEAGSVATFTVGYGFNFGPRF